MRLSRTLPILAALLLLGATVSVAGTTSKKPTTEHVSTKAHKSHHVTHHRKSRRHRPRGQQAIDSARAKEIQEALIREHYLKGEPTGKWDAKTKQAMQKYQGAQGWQTKTVPDSRALIRLGLGPDQEHLLNPESAMTTAPTVGHGASEPASSPVSSSAASASSSSGSMPGNSSQVGTPTAVSSGTPEQ